MDTSNITRYELEATHFLNGETLANFLDFGDFLSQNKISKTATSKPLTADAKNTRWATRYKKKSVCHFRAWRNHWFVSFFKTIDVNALEAHFTDEMKAFILAHIETKAGCKNCGGHKDRIVLGKHFPVVCGCNLLLVVNPAGERLTRVKDLVSIIKKVMDAQN